MQVWMLCACAGLSTPPPNMTAADHNLLQGWLHPELAALRRKEDHGCQQAETQLPQTDHTLRHVTAAAGDLAACACSPQEAHHWHKGITLDPVRGVGRATAHRNTTVVIISQVVHPPRCTLMLLHTCPLLLQQHCRWYLRPHSHGGAARHTDGRPCKPDAHSCVRHYACFYTVERQKAWDRLRFASVKLPLRRATCASRHAPKRGSTYLQRA